MKVCQGPYDSALIRAWEHWDSKHDSENDHPKEFQENQVVDTTTSKLAGFLSDEKYILITYRMQYISEENSYHSLSCFVSLTNGMKLLPVLCCLCSRTWGSGS